VAAADALLRQEPLGRPELFTTVDPASAAVVADLEVQASLAVGIRTRSAQPRSSSVNRG
jgi:hypothetical protein